MMNHAMMKEVELRQIGGHVEVYSGAGVFLFSADTLHEALQEALQELGEEG